MLSFIFILLPAIYLTEYVDKSDHRQKQILVKASLNGFEEYHDNHYSDWRYVSDEQNEISFIRRSLRFRLPASILGSGPPEIIRTIHPMLPVMPIIELKYPNGIRLRQERPRFISETFSFPGERQRYPKTDQRQERSIKLDDKIVIAKNSGIYIRDKKIELLPAQIEYTTEDYLYIIYGGPGDKVETLLSTMQNMTFNTFH